MAPYDGRDTTPDKVDMREPLACGKPGEIIASAASAAAVALELPLQPDGGGADQSQLDVHSLQRPPCHGRRGLEQGNDDGSGDESYRDLRRCRERSVAVGSGQVRRQAPGERLRRSQEVCCRPGRQPCGHRGSAGASLPRAFVAKLPERCLREAGRTGVMPAPTADELQKADGQVNHAMTLVGYDKNREDPHGTKLLGQGVGRSGALYDFVRHHESHRAVRNTTALDHHEEGAARKHVDQQNTGFRPVAVPPIPAPADRPERLADLAARMRDEIRRRC